MLLYYYTTGTFINHIKTSSNLFALWQMDYLYLGDYRIAIHNCFTVYKINFLSEHFLIHACSLVASKVVRAVHQVNYTGVGLIPTVQRIWLNFSYPSIGRFFRHDMADLLIFKVFEKPKEIAMSYV